MSYLILSLNSINNFKNTEMPITDFIDNSIWPKSKYQQSNKYSGKSSMTEIIELLMWKGN